MSKMLKWSGIPNVSTETAVIPGPSGPLPGKLDIQDGTPSPADVPTLNVALEAESVLERAHTEAAKVLQEAEQRAVFILEQAVTEANQRCTEAEQAGYASGYEAGTEQSNLELTKQSAELQARYEEQVALLHGERTRFFADCHVALTQLAMEAVRQLLSRELLIAPSNIEKMVGDLLTYVAESNQIEVRVHPNEYQAAAEAHPSWKAAKLGEWDVAVVPDSAVQPGGFEIRSHSGRVDARVETKLDILQSAVQSLLERSVSDHVANTGN